MSAGELSSISTALGELRQRLTAMADAQLAAGRDDTAAELYEVERALSTGERRLARVVDSAGA